MEEFGWQGLHIQKATGNLDQNFLFPHTIMPQDLQFLVTLQLAIMEEPSIFRLQMQQVLGRYSLIRLSTFTHGFNSDLRFIWLQIRSKGSSSVTVSAPVNAKIAPPGYYMIHVLNGAGVPSKAGNQDSWNIFMRRGSAILPYTLSLVFNSTHNVGHWR